jgi:hypothetical protein
MDESIMIQFSEKKLFESCQDMYDVMPDRAIMLGVTINPELNQRVVRNRVGRDNNIKP